MYAQGWLDMIIEVIEKYEVVWETLYIFLRYYNVLRI